MSARCFPFSEDVPLVMTALISVHASIHLNSVPPYLLQLSLGQAWKKTAILSRILTNEY